MHFFPEIYDVYVMLKNKQTHSCYLNHIVLIFTLSSTCISWQKIIKYLALMMMIMSTNTFHKYPPPPPPPVFWNLSHLCGSLCKRLFHVSISKYNLDSVWCWKSLPWCWSSIILSAWCLKCSEDTITWTHLGICWLKVLYMWCGLHLLRKLGFGCLGSFMSIYAWEIRWGFH